MRGTNAMVPSSIGLSGRLKMAGPLKAFRGDSWLTGPPPQEEMHHYNPIDTTALNESLLYVAILGTRITVWRVGWKRGGGGR